MGQGSIRTDSTPLPSGELTSAKPVFLRLTAMMLLEFVVFGSWFATLGLVLATNGLAGSIALAYSLAAVATIVSPMLFGALGDRFLPSQRVLGLAHLAGAGVMLFLPGAVRAGNGTTVLTLIFVYMLFFMPTLGLSNTIAFRHLGDNERLFPYIRVFGTVGWVVAGLGVGALALSASPDIFYVTAIASLVLGLYAFTLPSSPPVAKGARFSLGDMIGARAFPLLRQRNVAVFFICALLTSISLGVYNTYASPFLGALGIENVAGVLAIGQASEVLFIVVIPIVLSRIGMKWALLLGMCMWGVRFVLFIAAADGHLSMAVAAVALHGICNDFFLVIGAMYLNQVARAEIAAQAQNMLILVVSGLGALIGSYGAGEVYAAVVTADSGPGDWTPLWLVPIGAAILTTALWTAFFRDSRRSEA
ncbi:MFS transporter [Actinoplanes sp. RD1]|uniref:MFS transporter n=1 Tax=Actinoplanes sp. RD1 TaxID=3064538 RepID=UPI0027417756|nr:MFS transporter [Actinoplanes sp. RD1]